MPKIDLYIPHNLTQSAALTRIQKFLPELNVQHSDRIKDLEESWNGNTGVFIYKISGFKVSGTLQVSDNYVLINGELPFLASPFKGQIESTIKQQAKELLEKK